MLSVRATHLHGRRQLAVGRITAAHGGIPRPADTPHRRALSGEQCEPHDSLRNMLCDYQPPSDTALAI